MKDLSRYGQLEPLPAHYQDRDARLRVMDEQHLERAFLFPTLAVGVEGLNPTEVDMTYKVFRAFNEWLDDDWGYDYANRLYSAPAIPVLDPQLATEELERVIAAAPSLIALRPGPANGRSPADPTWDPFWARAQEADIPVAYHTYGGLDAYGDAFRLLWQRNGVGDRAYEGNLQQAWVGRPTHARHRTRTGARQPVRTLPASAHPQRRARMCMGAVLHARARPLGWSPRPAHPRVRRERARATVGDLPAPLLGVAVPGGGHRRAQRPDRRRPRALRIRLAPRRRHAAAGRLRRSTSRSSTPSTPGRSCRDNALALVS